MFKFKLKGTGVNPRSVPLNDLIELSEAIQRALTPLIRDMSEEEKVARSLSLVGVEEGSACYAMYPQTTQMQQAWNTVYDAMRRDDYNDLPDQTLRNLHKINDFIEKKSYVSLQFAERDQFTQSSIEVTKTKPLRLPADEVIECVTSIYGRLVRVGGVKPTAVIQLPNGQTLTCSVSEELASNISASLYKDIGLEGVAYWQVPGWRLHDFSVKKASIYDHSRTAKQTFDDMKKLVEGEYDNIDDVDDFIRKLRGE